MLQILRHNMPAVVQRIRRSVRRKPVEAEGGKAKESPSILSFLTQVLERFPEAKEAVLRGLREMRGGPMEPIPGST
jgi:hypothetical protein